LNVRIEHVALWTRDLEKSRAFYETYFGGKAGHRYVNPVRQFESYFITFEGGTRLEIMYTPAVQDKIADMFIGWTHIAMSLGSRENVNQMTETLRQAGYVVAGEPRVTGDGYYESIILDPDGNRIELTV
jgi:lactoylglutathione lyase